MSMKRGSRRDFLTTVAAGSAAAAWPAPALSQDAARIVVVGGGFAGASCARTLKKINPRLSVTLVETNETFTALPLSNAVLGGLRPLRVHQFGYRKIAAGGVALRLQTAIAVEPRARNVVLANGDRLAYDRLVLAPGIELRLDAIAGYSEAAAEHMPHAWMGGKQLAVLLRKLDAMQDGGVVVIAAPVNPARCPPGPYERASMVAHGLSSRKPRSKVIVLDAKDTFAMQRQFQSAWAALYPGRLEWVSLSQGGNVTGVDVASSTFITDFETYRADVGNVIPPQRAGRIAQVAGVADRTGWCPVDPLTFESQLQPNIHVIGDATMAGGLPKSAAAANEQGKLCATAIGKLLDGSAPPQPRLASICYSLIAPDYAISIAGVYHPVSGQYLEVEGTGATSPVEAPRSLRAQEASFADSWFKTITQEIFG